MTNSQDYLYMLQMCIAFGALIALFLVFRYETIDRYADNRKEVLRLLLDIKSNPERADWIQRIGKGDIGVKAFDEELRSLRIPSVDTFIDEILDLRKTRRKLVKRGECAVIFWGLLAVVYLFAQVFQWYQIPHYQLLMFAFLAPLLFSIWFLRWALGPLH